MSASLPIRIFLLQRENYNNASAIKRKEPIAAIRVLSALRLCVCSDFAACFDFAYRTRYPLVHFQSPIFLA